MMAFPQDDFNIEVKLDINGDGVFDTDISQYVLNRDSGGGIRIRRGRTSEGGLVDPGTCSFELNNRDGRFSPRNPQGAYYGQIGRNTPIQVAVKGGATYLHCLSTSSVGASTPDSASLSITGDIDIRFEATLDNWFAAGNYDGTTELCGKGDFAASNRAWILMVRNDYLHFEWSADGTNLAGSIDSTAKPLIPLHRRLAVRVTLDVNNGAAGNTVTFYTSDSISGTWTQLGDPVVSAGTTSIKDEANAVNVGQGWPSLGFDSCVGKIHAFELRNGIGGTVVASPDFTVQTDGATSFADAQGNTWTRGSFPSANITDLDVRFTGEMTSWPNRWDTSGNDIWVEVDAKGVLRRLDAGRTTLDSTLRRRIPTFSPLAYWPMEDGGNSTRFYSPIAGVRPLTQTGMDLASDNTLGGSSALPVVRTGAYLSGSAPGGSTATQWRWEFVYNFPTAPASNVTLLRLGATGTAHQWELKLRTGNLNVSAFDIDGASVVNQDVAVTDSDVFNVWNRMYLKASQSGGNVSWEVGIITIGGTAGVFSGSFAGTVGNPTAVTGGQPVYGSGADGLILGHIAIFDVASSTAFDSADTGFDGETAGERVDRLCTEEDVPLVIHGWKSETEQMGPQGPSTFLNLLRDCADGDEGLLCESRDSLSVKFVGLASITNQEPTLTLTYPDHIQPGLEPDPDDFLVENDVTVTRSLGSSGRVEVTDGALSVNAPPDGVNRYENTYELDIYSDDRTDDHAGWKAHLGTVDEERYPSVSVWVSADPSLFGQVSLLDVATLLRITNNQTGVKLPPGDIDLLIQGYEEFLNQRRWEFDFYGTPYSGYRVGLVGDTEQGRLDTDGSIVQATITSTATSMNVTTTSGPFWTRDSSEVPFDLMVGGERMTATAITGVAQDDFSDNQTDTWGSADVGGTWTNTGGVAGNFDKTGGRGTHTLTTTNAQRLSSLTASVGISSSVVDVQTSALATGAALCGGLVARYTDASNFYTARLAFNTDQTITLTIRKVVAGVESQLGSFTLGPAHAATTDYRLRFELNSTTLRARAWFTGKAEPGFWQVSVTDSSLSSGGFGLRSIALTGNTNASPVVSYDNYVVENPVTMTVTRSVNDVVKAQSSFTDVRLYQPMIIALN